MQCDGCTECCNTFPVVELNKGVWENCQYADNGCKIYNLRPNSCRKCECAYMQNPKVSQELRPDNCGVIFERSDKTMVGTIIGPMSLIVKGQIRSFKNEGFEVLLQRKGK
jgi:hypothetical protein